MPGEKSSESTIAPIPEQQKSTHPSPLPQPPKSGPIMTTAKFVKDVSKYLVFCSLWLLYQVFQYVLGHLDGTRWRVAESRKPENFTASAHVMDVIAKFKFDPLVGGNRLSDFILRHRSFDHPSCVLRDEVSLYDINEREAIFVEAPPGVEVWQHKYNSFHTHAQLANAVRVIVMPTESFYRISDEIGDPKKLVFITNTARCGSTLMSRLFEETDVCVAISEPHAMNVLVNYRGRDNEPWVKNHTKAVVRMLCKPTNLKAKAYAIKITATSISLVPILQELYPDSAMVFIYRDCMPVIKSMMRIWQELPLGYLSITIASMCPRLFRYILDVHKFFEEIREPAFKRLVPGYGQACFYWANFIHHYLMYRRQGIDIAGIRYEDLVRHPELVVARIFEHCAIPMDLVKPALRAFKSDSQASSWISMKRLQVYKAPEFSKEAIKQIDDILTFYKLPALGEECILPGTITGTSSSSSSSSKTTTAATAPTVPENSNGTRTGMANGYSCHDNMANGKACQI